MKQCTQNDFVNGELGRCNFLSKRCFSIIKYWLKIIHCQNTKYVKIVYDMLVSDFISFPNIISWVKLLHDLLCELGFMEAWIQQNVGNEHAFLFLAKQRLKDTFVQNWNSRLNDSSRARFYRNFNTFGYKTYLYPHSTGRRFRYAHGDHEVSLKLFQIAAEA